MGVDNRKEYWHRPAWSLGLHGLLVLSIFTPKNFPHLPSHSSVSVVEQPVCLLQSFRNWEIFRFFASIEYHNRDTREIQHSSVKGKVFVWTGRTRATVAFPLAMRGCVSSWDSNSHVWILFFVLVYDFQLVAHHEGTAFSTFHRPSANWDEVW